MTDVTEVSEAPVPERCVQAICDALLEADAPLTHSELVDARFEWMGYVSSVLNYLIDRGEIVVFEGGRKGHSRYALKSRTSEKETL